MYICMLYQIHQSSFLGWIDLPGTSDGNNTGAIVGSVIALLIAIVVVASFVLMKRKNIGFQEILEMIPRKRSDEACMGENDI